MALDLPRLSRCCFCFSLRTGSLIIGYISIIASILFISATSFFLYKVVQYIDHNQNQTNTEHSPEEIANTALGFYVSQAYYLLVYTYLLVISIILVVGVHTARPRLLKIYTFSGFFLLGVALALVVVSIVFVGIFETLPLLKWCITHLFCLLIVRSTYLEMEDQNKPRVYELQTLYNPLPQQNMA